MTLKNLLGISLDVIQPDAATIGKLLAAAQRNLADAQLAGLSAENRFDAACKAIMQLAMVALQANGYRTLTSKPGHHQTAIQTLAISVGVAPGQVIRRRSVRCSDRERTGLGEHRVVAGRVMPESAQVPRECGRRIGPGRRHIAKLRPQHQGCD